MRNRTERSGEWVTIEAIRRWRNPSHGGGRDSENSSGALDGWTLSRAAGTQYCADFSYCKNGKKAGDARTNRKLGPFIFVELYDLIDQHARFPSQKLDGALLEGLLAELGVHSEIHAWGLRSPPSGTRRLTARSVRVNFA